MQSLEADLKSPTRTPTRSRNSQASATSTPIQTPHQPHPPERNAAVKPSPNPKPAAKNANANYERPCEVLAEGFGFSIRPRPLAEHRSHPETPCWSAHEVDSLQRERSVLTGGWWTKCGGILLARAGNRWSRLMILGRDCLDELEVCRLIRGSLGLWNRSIGN